MIKLIKNPSKGLVESFLNNKVLYKLQTGKEWEQHINMDPNHIYLVGIDDQLGTLVGLVDAEPKSIRVAETHIYTMPEVWGKGFSVPFAEAVINTLHEVYGFTYLNTMCPEQCHGTQEFVKGLGFKEIQLYKKAAMYRGVPSDVHFYVYEMGGVG